MEVESDTVNQMKDYICQVESDLSERMTVPSGKTYHL